MAADFPPDKDRLIADVASLTEIRERMEDYLATLERNTDSVGAWLAANREKIIIGHHRLVRAIVARDDVKAAAIVASLGDVAGFVLEMQDFKTSGAAAFGEDSRFIRAVAAVTYGLPKDIVEDLVALDVPAGKVQAERKPAPAPAPQPEKKKWWSVSSWFSNEEEKRAGQAREEEERIRRKWRTVRDEILGLQSDRHYYVDSFMDWVADGFAAETMSEEGRPVVSSKAMLQYQEPAYILRLAEADYAEVVGEKARGLKEQALEYSALASLLDEQDIGGFCKAFEGLFPKAEDAKATLAKKLLLQDFGAASFAEMALKHVKEPQARLELFRAALSKENEIVLFGFLTKKEIFEKVLSDVLAEKDPLPPEALKVILDRLGAKSLNDAQLSEVLSLDERLKPSVFERVVARFQADYPMQGKALSFLSRGINGGISASDLDAYDVVDCARALDEKSAVRLSAALRQVAAKKSAEGFTSLWYLAHPKRKLLKEMTAMSSDAKVVSALLGDALDAGVLGELAISPSGIAPALDLFEHHILNNPGAFSLTTARKALLVIFEGHEDMLRTVLTQSGVGWFENILKSNLSEKDKLSWVAALLEPFPSDIVRANVLHEAARKTRDPLVAETLKQMEVNLVGENIRLGDDRLLVSLPKIANIWYNSDTGEVKYTVQGASHLLADGVSPAMAGDILSFLQRRGRFEAEDGGLFRAENIDEIQELRGETKIHWHRISTRLHVEPAVLRQLQGRPDFVHEEDAASGCVHSINTASLCLLQPLADGTHLAINKYGTASILDGDVTVTDRSPLVNLGNGAYFNPGNASVLRLDPSRGTLEFRIEGADFEKFMEKTAADSYFFTVPVADGASMKALKDAIAGSEAMTGTGSLGGNPQIYLNMKALEYMIHDPARQGFHCRRYSPAGKHGLIRTEDEALTDSILQSLSRQDGVIKVGRTAVHVNSIDNVYYNGEKGTLYFVIGREVIDTPCGMAEAQKLMQKLLATPGFTAALALSAGGATPMDIINLNNVTHLSYSLAQNKAIVTSDVDRFHVNLTRDEMQEFLGHLEEQGLKKARAATAGAAWTQELSAAADKLPLIVLTGGASFAGSREERFSRLRKALATVREKFTSVSRPAVIASSPKKKGPPRGKKRPPPYAPF